MKVVLAFLNSPKRPRENIHQQYQVESTHIKTAKQEAWLASSAEQDKINVEGRVSPHFLYY